MMTITYNNQPIVVLEANAPKPATNLLAPVVRIGSKSCFASAIVCPHCYFNFKPKCVSHIYSYINSSEFANKYPEFFL